MSRCMCEPLETAQSLGDDTRAVVARPKWAREHGLHRVWSRVTSMGCEAGPSMSCSDKDAGRSERKTPNPSCGNKQAENRSKDKDRTTHDRKCRWAKRRKMTWATSSVMKMMPMKLRRPPTRRRWTRSGTSHRLRAEPASSSAGAAVAGAPSDFPPSHAGALSKFSCGAGRLREGLVQIHTDQTMDA